MERFGKRPLERLRAPLFILIAVLVAYVLLTRLERYAELAERAAMQTTLISLTTELQVRFVLDTRRAAPAALAAAWDGGNPVALAGMAPPNYLGARRGVDARAVPGDSWLFDEARRELVYVPRLASHLIVRGARAPAPALRFALRVEHAQGGGWTIRLVPMVSYTWKF